MRKKKLLENISNNSSGKSGLVAALDVGTNKIVCLIAKLEPNKREKIGQKLRIVGFGHQMSAGVQGGTIVDLERAEMAIRSTVETAEREAGENIKSVIVNLGAPILQSRLIAFDVSIAGHKVSELDLQRIFQQPIWKAIKS